MNTMTTQVGSKDFRIAIMILSGMGGLIALVTYLEGRQYRKMQKEIAALDLQLKKLQLQKKD